MQIIIQFIRVRDIDTRMHDDSKFVLLNFYIHEKTIDDSNIIHFKRKIHIVDELKIKMFIEMNIFDSKNIIIDIENKILIIDNCEITFFLSIIFKRERVDRIMRCIILIIILSHIIITIIVKFRERAFSIDKNYNSHFISNVKLNSKKNLFI